MKEKLTPLRSADFEAGAAHERQTIIAYQLDVLEPDDWDQY